MDKDFLIYGYSSPTDGYWYYDGKEEHYTGEDYRTEERYREYKDCGFNLLFLQNNDPYRGEEWETSQTKKNMDNAYAAGIKKVTVCDRRLLELSDSDGGVIGETMGVFKPFKDEKHLREFVAYCMKDYIKHPAFYGVMLIDEPSWKKLPSVAQMTKAIKEVAPQAFVQCNLLPLYAGSTHLFVEGGEKLDSVSVDSSRKAFVKYITDYLDTSDSQVLTYDSYPMREEPDTGKFILRYHLAGLQASADELKKRNKQFHLVLQAVEYITDGRIRFRRPSEEDMRWQTNAALAFGVKGFSYYSYWAKQQNSFGGDHVDGSSFITHDGRQTPLYHAVKKIHGELAELKYLLDCEYDDSTFYADESAAPEYVKFMYKRDLTGSVRIRECNTSALIITRLRHKTDGNAVICLFNAEDPEVNPVTAKIKAEFGGETVKTFLLKNPKGFDEKEITLEAGDAAFIVVKEK